MLEARRADGLWRRRACLDSPQGPRIVVDGRRYLTFSSNDYLGLAADPRLVEAFDDAVRRYGLGSGASHLVTGHSRPHAEFEAAFADFAGRPRALLFGSGYLANLGVLSVLGRAASRTYHDRLNHASLLDGSRLAGRPFRRYPHLDTGRLGRWLERQGADERPLIVSDGVFSMDGDRADIPGLAALARRHRARLYIDDAHGCGVLGPGGRGSIALPEIAGDERPPFVATLGKAFGAYGAVVAGDEELIESLLQFARPYVYTTALPPALAAVASRALEIVAGEDWRREHLAGLVRRFHRLAGEAGLPVAPCPDVPVPIVPLVVGAADRAMALSDALRRRGLLVTAIRPPTVPEGSARLRITFSAAHREHDVDRLVEALAEACR